MNRLNYIANSIGPEGIDELQSLLMCQEYGLHAALSGPPGTGKTRSVSEVARILGRPLFSKTCSSRTSESHIISFPSLERDGEATVTRHRNGVLAQAMEAGGIFYGDEFNLLRSDVQKRLNSATDDRRMIDRNDGVQVRAADGFWAVISYNPSRDSISCDLEESVADRFVHFHFGKWQPEFLGFVSHSMAAARHGRKPPPASRYRIALEIRGICSDGSFCRADVNRSGGRTWRDSFTDKERDEAEIEWVYRAYHQDERTHPPCRQPSASSQRSTASVGGSDLAMGLSTFVDTLAEIADTGSSPLLRRIGLEELHRREDADLLHVHSAGARIISAALTIYRHLVTAGMAEGAARSYATRLVIDQACYGQYRDEKFLDMTNHAFATSVARALGLLGGSRSLNTGFRKAG